MVELFYSETLLRFFVSLPLETRLKILSKIEMFREGLWPFVVRIREFKVKRTPIILDTTLLRGLRLLFSVHRQENLVQVFFWGLEEYNEKGPHHILPRNTSFIYSLSRSDNRLPSLRLANIPTMCLSRSAHEPRGFIPPSWYDDTSLDSLMQSDTRHEQLLAQLLYKEGPSYPRPAVVNENITRLRIQVQKLLGNQAETEPKQGTAPGRLPILIHDVTPRALLDTIQTWPGSTAILVNKPEQQALLEGLAPTISVFTTPTECQGPYRFDSLVLWHYAELQKESPDPESSANLAELTDLLECLHRVTYELSIFESRPEATLWTLTSLQDHILITDDLDLVYDQGQPIRGNADWCRLGKTYVDYHQYRAASVCFWLGDSKEKQRVAAAYQLQQEGRWGDAATLFEESDMLTHAARNYEAAELWNLAARLWRRLNRREDGLRCRIKLLERKERWRDIARLLENNHKFEDAAQMYVKAQMYSKAAYLYHKRLNQLEVAAELYEQGKIWKKAARLREVTGQMEQAAALYVRANQPQHAERIYEEMGSPERLREQYEQLGWLEDLLEYYERRRKLPECLALLEGMQMETLLQQAREYDERGQSFMAYIRYLVLEDFERAGEIAMRLQRYGEAAECFSRLGDHYRAGRAYGKNQQYHTAIGHLLLSQREEDSNFRVTRRYFCHVEDGWLLEKARELMALGYHNRAAWFFNKLESKLDLGICQAIAGDMETAILTWSQIDDPSGINHIAELCLAQDQIQAGAQLILDSPELCFPSWLRGRINERETPAFFELIARYFEEVEDQTRALNFAERLRARDASGDMAHLVLLYFERARDYQGCLDYLNHLEQDLPDAHLRIRHHFEEQLETPAQLSLGSLVLRYLFIKDTSALAQAVQKLPLDEKTIPLHLACGQQLRVARYLLQRPDQEERILTLCNTPELAREIAIQAIKQERILVAGRCFLSGRFYKEALQCFRKVRSNYWMGITCLARSKLSEALRYFLNTQPTPHEQLGKAYERLGDWHLARDHFLKAGLIQDVRRCDRHLEQ